MSDDEVDEIVRVVEVYLSGRLCAADWRLWLLRHDEAERAAAQFRRSYNYCRTSSSDEAW
jgi:hypothetical protein